MLPFTCRAVVKGWKWGIAHTVLWEHQIRGSKITSHVNMNLNTWYFARLHLHYFRKSKAERKSNHHWLQKAHWSLSLQCVRLKFPLIPCRKPNKWNKADPAITFLVARGASMKKNEASQVWIYITPAFL